MGLCSVASVAIEHGMMLLMAMVVANTAAIGSCSKDTYYACSCSTQFCYNSVPDHHYSVQSCTTETSGLTGDTAWGTTLHSIRDTENEARGCRASSVCPLACPIFKIPFSVFIVFLISCCGRHCRSAPALETSLLKQAQVLPVLQSVLHTKDTYFQFGAFP